MQSPDPSTPATPPGSSPRRVLLLGAGPLPAPSALGAPGVANRLAHFLEPALAAGHECLVFSLEPDAPPLGERTPETRRSGDRAWRCLSAGIGDFQQPQHWIRHVAAFAPDTIAGVGTLQAAVTACELAGDRPVWVDLFGDPLAEIQAKGALLADAFDPAEHLHAWELMLRVLQRADAFSTVSRRQRDALLGQLLLLGMSDGDSQEADSLADLIHCIPCGAASFDPPIAPLTAADRESLLAAQGIPPDARIALWSGGFNAWADPATLIRGVEHAMTREDRLWLVATGGALPNYLAQVDEEARRLAAGSPFSERIRLLGWLPLEDSARWAAAADVGLIVDRPCAETRLGARNRLLTFAAARCPIVATRGVEAVEEMEAAGALTACEPGAPDALRRSILSMLENRAEADRQARRAVDFCERMYRFDATARPFLDFIAGASGATKAISGAQPTVAETIAAMIDPERRRAERAELARYRSGRLTRVRRWWKDKLG